VVLINIRIKEKMMKTKNSDIAVKIFLVVVAVILVGLIIAWSTGVFKDKRNDLNEGTAKINSAISSMAEFDLLFYDGGTITGILLLDLIKESDVTISYRTLENANVSPIPAPPTGNTDVNLNALFKGEIVRDANNVITELIFTQQR
jgi:hypothetical protein